MEHKLKLHVGLMFILSMSIGYVVFGIISPPEIGVVYGFGFIAGRSFSSTLVPLIIVSLPAVLYKRIKKQPMPGYYISLWGAWFMFAAISIFGNLIIN